MRVLPKCFPMRCLGLANCSSKCCSPWRSFCEWRGCVDIIFNRIHLNQQFTSKKSFQTVPNLIFNLIFTPNPNFLSNNITSVLKHHPDQCAERNYTASSKYVPRDYSSFNPQNRIHVIWNSLTLNFCFSGTQLPPPFGRYYWTLALMKVVANVRW